RVRSTLSALPLARSAADWRELIDQVWQMLTQANEQTIPVHAGLLCLMMPSIEASFVRGTIFPYVRGPIMHPWPCLLPARSPLSPVIAPLLSSPRLPAPLLLRCPGLL